MKIVAPRLRFEAALALMVLLLMGALAACGGAGGGNSGTNSGTSSGTNGGTPPAGAEYIYVSDTVGQLFGFSIEPNSGALTPLRSGHPMDVVGVGATGVVRIAADPNGLNLYYSRAQLAGGPNLGVLFWTPASPSHDAGELGTWSDMNNTLSIPPGKLAVDPSGKNLYVIPDPSANLQEILSFAIAPGTPHSPHLIPLSTPTTGVPGVPHDVAVDASGHYAYATFAGAAGVQVAGYSRDQATGALTDLPNSPFTNMGGDNSQGIRIAPSGSFAFVANAATNNVSVMSLEAATGALTNVAGSPFAAGTSPLAVAIDRSSKFVFVANEGDNTLSAYALGAAGGLSAISGSPFSVDSRPQSVTGDLSGKFVYVATATGNVWGFTLNPATSSLTPMTGSPFHPNLVNNSADLGLCVPCGEELRDIVVLKP